MPSSVSIILPVRNEREHIETCLESIMRQEGIGPCEVLVIDGMSDDGTREILTRLQKRYPAMTVIDNPAKQVTSAVNIGIKNASGAIIMRMDAHALYAPDYIAACLRVMEQTGAANVGGHAFALPSTTRLMANAIALAHHSSFGLGGASFRNINAQGEVETVWPGCFKKEVFDNVGPLREELTRSEDIELNYRIRKAGYRIYLSPEIRLFYFCRATLGGLWQQRFLDGKGVVQTLQINAGAVRLRHFAPLLVVSVCFAVIIWGMVSLLFACNSPLNAALITAAAGAGLYLFLCIWFSFLSFFDTKHLKGLIAKNGLPKVNINPCAASLLPLVFIVLHFSYGLGSLWGLISRKQFLIQTSPRPKRPDLSD
jgi:succinoglycan biosynthesis protein ExoA